MVGAALEAMLFVTASIFEADLRDALTGSPSPVVEPLDPEVSPGVAVADVADVETFVKSVSSRTDDAVEATAVVPTGCATTDHLRVVPQ